MSTLVGSLHVTVS